MSTLKSVASGIGTLLGLIALLGGAIFETDPGARVVCAIFFSTWILYLRLEAIYQRLGRLPP